MIILDTVRAKNMSCYGYHKNTTPFLDSLSKQCVLFENAFSPAIWTIPSHASIFTGTYPSQHGALNLHRHLDNRYNTLAEVLSFNGYDTISFSNNYFVSLKEFGLTRGFNLTEGFKYPVNRLEKAYIKGKRWLARSMDSGAYVTNHFVNKWIKQKRNSQKPFFLFLNHMEGHAPYVHTPREYLKMFLKKEEQKKLKHINQDRQKYLTRSIEMSEDNFNILRSVYDAQISYLDSMLKELFNILKSNNLFDNSLIIITSDHGDMIGEHNLVHHSYCLYEELIKVPLLLKMPGNVDNTKIINHLVSLIDIFPTISELLDIGNKSLGQQLQGHNLFLNDNQVNREYIFLECEKPKNEFAETYPDFDFSIYDRQLLAIRSKKDKYIWTSDNNHELYDIEKNPSEQFNIITTMPERAKHLEKQLFQWYNSLEKTDTEKQVKEFELDHEIKEHLKGLGYF